MLRFSSPRRRTGRENVRITLTLSAMMASVLASAATGARSSQSEVIRAALQQYLDRPIEETIALPPYAHALLDGVDDWPAAGTALGWSSTVPFERSVAGEESPPTGSKRISFAVTEEFREQIYQRSREEHRGVASLTRRAIEWYLFEQVVLATKAQTVSGPQPAKAGNPMANALSAGLQRVGLSGRQRPSGLENR
jgi:hypothetical protein